METFANEPKLAKITGVKPDARVVQQKTLLVSVACL